MTAIGFDAGEEVIVGVGERLAESLRASDIIGRTAGNKFGVILKNCKEREIAVVAARLRARCATTPSRHAPARSPPPCSVGAVWLPLAASNSQEAMLRAEQALERARANGRDGFAVYAAVAPARNGALAPDGHCRRGDAGAEGKSPPAGLSAHHRAPERASPSIMNACCACCAPDGSRS